MHWAVRFDGDVLEVALKGPVDDYRSRLAPLLDAGRIIELMHEHEQHPHHHHDHAHAHE
jgi:hypothetical protein